MASRNKKAEVAYSLWELNREALENDDFANPELKMKVQQDEAYYQDLYLKHSSESDGETPVFFVDEHHGITAGPAHQ